MFHHFFFQDGSYAIRFLQPRMLTYQKLNALVFEVVKHDALVVARDTDRPLFKLPHNALTTLFGYSRDIALCPRILEAQMVSILDKQVLDHFENGPCWRSSKDRARVIVERESISLSKAAVVTLELDFRFRF